MSAPDTEPRPLRAALLLVAALLLSSCGDSPTGPGDRRGIQFVAGANVTDTVVTEPAQALVVQIYDEGGELQRGVVVRFESLPVESGAQWQIPSVLVARIETGYFGTLVPDTTDSRGRAAASIRLGTRSGPGGVIVRVPELGLVDTARFTILPGNGVDVRALPKDTALYPGRSFTLRSTTVDRYGNLRDDPVDFTIAEPGVALEGRVVTAGGAGRALVIARAFGEEDTTSVSIVPEGILAAGSPQGLVMFNTDGSGVRHLAPGIGAFTTDWSPTGDEVAFDAQWGARIRVVDLDGNIRTASSDASTASELYPEFAPDGNSIYYARDGWRLRRVGIDGTGDELVPIATPATDVAPSLSPDGTQLVYVVTSGGGDDYLHIVTLASGDVRALNVRGHSPAWSPRGDQIAYIDSRGSVLGIVAPDGTGARVLSTGSYGFGLDWSPDGEWLVAKSGTKNRIELIDPESGLVLPLGFTAGYSGPSWRP